MRGRAGGLSLHDKSEKVHSVSAVRGHRKASAANSPYTPPVAALAAAELDTSDLFDCLDLLSESGAVLDLSVLLP